MARLLWNVKQTNRLIFRPQICPYDLTLAMTLTLNFQGQIWNLLYLKQKWSDLPRNGKANILLELYASDATYMFDLGHALWDLRSIVHTVSKAKSLLHQVLARCYHEIVMAWGRFPLYCTEWGEPTNWTNRTSHWTNSRVTSNWKHINAMCRHFHNGRHKCVVDLWFSTLSFGTFSRRISHRKLLLASLHYLMLLKWPYVYAGFVPKGQLVSRWCSIAIRKYQSQPTISGQQAWARDLDWTYLYC